MEENLLAHTFVIIVNGIKMESDQVIKCSITYNYSLFSKEEEIIVDNLVIAPNKREFLRISDPSGFKKHTVPWSCKESEVKLFLEEQHLDFKVFDKNKLIGTSSANLSRLKTNMAEKVPFGFRYVVEIPILDTQFKTIGVLDCLFVLETEQFTRCKCQIVKPNSIPVYFKS